MDAQRRLLLKGVVVGGLSGPGLIGSSMSLASDPAGAAMHAEFTKPILALVDGRAEYSAFVQGMQAADHSGSLQLHNTSLGLDFLLTLQRHVQNARGKYILGLVDDACGTLIVEFARAAGACVHWLGQHAVSLDRSHHQLLSSQIVDGRAASLIQQLVVHGASSDFNRQSVGRGMHSSRLTQHLCGAADRDRGQWAVDLGHALASLGRTAIPAAPRMDAGLMPATGHFISFAFET
ncbi:hypothetical protein [Nitrosomonas sp. ANs5]|uniref:hypothetical protein n=1 Tax=Nitrosomonas sp. ANs5 TaxID=3423941 RepID=UPI003D328B79